MLFGDSPGKGRLLVGARSLIETNCLAALCAIGTLPGDLTDPFAFATRYAADASHIGPIVPN